MSLKKLQILAAAASLAFVGAANAQQMNGSFAVADVYGGGSAGPGTLTMFSTSLITTGISGTFAGIVPALSDLTANTATISGIGSSPTPENINDYLSFSTPDSTFGGAGTSPLNRFEFNLSTLQTDGSGGGTYAFFGQGTLVDEQVGGFDPTPAEMTVSYSGPGSYSFTFAAIAVPEPTTISLFATGLLGMWSIRCRKI